MSSITLVVTIIDRCNNSANGYLIDSDVEAGRDDSALVESAVEFNDNFTSSVVVDDFKLADVAVLHHNLQKLDNDLNKQ